jgi:hypothetical protein
MTITITPQPVLPLAITPIDFRFCPWNQSSKAPAIHGWFSAGSAVYMPVYIPGPYPVARVFWYNGTVTGNCDFGIYDLNNNLLFSIGSTAQAGASAAQYVNVNWTINTGNYYIAMAHTSTGQFLADESAAIPIMQVGQGLKRQVVFPLGATMTGVVMTTTYIPLCGITRLAAF